MYEVQAKQSSLGYSNALEKYEVQALTHVEKLDVQKLKFQKLLESSEFFNQRSGSFVRS